MSLCERTWEKRPKPYCFVVHRCALQSEHAGVCICGCGAAAAFSRKGEA